MKSRDPRSRNPASGYTLGVEDEEALWIAQTILPREGDRGLVNPEYLDRVEGVLLRRGETGRREAEAQYTMFLGCTDEQLETVAVALTFAFSRPIKALLCHPDYEVARGALPLLQGLLYLVARGLIAFKGEDRRVALFTLPPSSPPSEAMERAIVSRIEGLFTGERVERILERVRRVPPI